MNQKKHHITLKPSESAIAQIAGQIYAAQIASGNASEGDAEQLMKRSISDAIKIVKTVDDIVLADGEMH